MPRARPRLLIWAIVPALAVVNVANNRWVGPAGYVPVSVAASVGLVLFARHVVGLGWDSLGLARRNVRSGLRWGLTILGIVAVVMVAGVALPWTRPLFEDDRVRTLTGWDTLYAAFVRVTFGTVLLEEVAFRGVLPAVFGTIMTRWRALVLSALLFGFWHVLPSIGMADVNPLATDTVGRFPTWVTVAGAVGSTTLVGLWLSFLRVRSKSLLAPMLSHWSTNALGYLFAYAALEWL